MIVLTDAGVRHWRSHPMMAVAGCIDSNGAIFARATPGIDGHRASESRGKRWRWIIHRQEFHVLPPKTLEERKKKYATAG